MTQTNITDYQIKKPKHTQTIWDHESELCRGKITFNWWFFKVNFNEKLYDSSCEFKATQNYMKTSIHYFLKEFMNIKKQEIRFYLSFDYSFKYKFKHKKNVMITVLLVKVVYISQIVILVGSFQIRLISLIILMKFMKR